MSAKPVSIALVSGKGGVGKTSIASNVAWACSKYARTILVDIDFQNQGSTGLFAAMYKFEGGNAYDGIRNPESLSFGALTKAEEDLYFLPTVSWKRGLRKRMLLSIQIPKSSKKT